MTGLYVIAMAITIAGFGILKIGTELEGIKIALNNIARAKRDRGR